MNPVGLLKLVVRISYPKNSLTPEEQESSAGCGPVTRSLYFFEGHTAEEYETRMAHAWRPGATAMIYHYYINDDWESIKADKRRGEWLPLDAPFSEIVGKEKSERKGNNRRHFY